MTPSGSMGIVPGVRPGGVANTLATAKGSRTKARSL